MDILRKYYDLGLYHFTLFCLWQPESRAYFIQCQSYDNWSLSGLKASGASKAAIVDTILSLPRMILIIAAVVFLDIMYFTR